MRAVGIWFALALSTTCFVTALVAGAPYTDLVPAAAVLLSTALAVFLAIGALISWRVPGNLIGPLLLLLGVSIPLQMVAGVVVASAAPSAWWWTAFYLDGAIGIVAPGIAFVGIPLLVPNGRPWWPWLWRLGVTYIAAYLALTVFGVGSYALEAPGGPTLVANPLALANLDAGAVEWLFIAYPVLAILAGAAAVSRHRASDGMERLQLRAFVSIVLLAVLILPLSLVVESVAEAVGVPGLVGAAGFGFAVAVFLLPISIGVAVLRYRLYDIGRIVSRTLTYATLVGIVAIAYAAGALWLPTRFGLPDDPLWVAATTLVIALAFNPVRRRLTRFLDRRFNRTPYDPEELVESLGSALQSVTEPDQVLDQWSRSIQEALQPSSLAVWIGGSRP